MGLGMKMLVICGIVAGVLFSYLIMFALQPATNTIIETANATGNWSVDPAFEMAQGVMNSFPLWQWFIPAFIGLFGIVMVWRSG